MQKAWIAPVLQKRQRQRAGHHMSTGATDDRKVVLDDRRAWKRWMETLFPSCSSPTRALHRWPRRACLAELDIELASQVVVLSRVSISKQACLNAREHAVSTPSPVKRDINCASILDRLGCGGSYPYARLTHGLPLATSKCWSCKFAHRWPASIPPVGPA